MAVTSHIRRFAALLLTASLLLALCACGGTEPPHGDASPAVSSEAPAVPSVIGEEDEPSDMPPDAEEPSVEPEVPETSGSVTSEAASPAPDGTPSPDAAAPSEEPAYEEPVSEEPASGETPPEDAADGGPASTGETPSGSDAEPPDTAASPEGTSSSGTLYVLNTNSKKFHLPTCSSVGRIKQENRLDSSESRDAIIAQGYSPCKNCDP